MFLEMFAASWAISSIMVASLIITLLIIDKSPARALLFANWRIIAVGVILITVVVILAPVAIGVAGGVVLYDRKERLQQ